MPNSKNYYDILGVKNNASPEDIKSAYRKMAREHHPDMVGPSDKDAAEKRFKEINEAYQVLSDTEKRKVYDQYGSSAFTNGGGVNQGFNGFGGFGGAGGARQGQWGPFTYSYTSTGGANQSNGFGDMDPFDVFEQFFGSRGFGGSGRNPRKGKNLYYEIHIDFTEAVFGLEKDISIESGKVKIKIPAGVHDGTELRFSEKGMKGPNGVPNGDLLITVRVKQPRDFTVNGENIYIQKEIDFVDAVLGDTIDIPSVDLSNKTGIGKSTLRIPSGTQSGTRFVVRGKGMPRLGRSGQGDLYVQVFVKIPSKISRKQKEILETYKNTL